MLWYTLNVHTYVRTYEHLYVHVQNTGKGLMYVRTYIMYNIVRLYVY